MFIEQVLLHFGVKPGNYLFANNLKLRLPICEILTTFSLVFYFAVHRCTKLFGTKVKYT